MASRWFCLHKIEREALDADAATGGHCGAFKVELLGLRWGWGAFDFLNRRGSFNHGFGDVEGATQLFIKGFDVGLCFIKQFDFLVKALEDAFVSTVKRIDLDFVAWLVAGFYKFLYIVSFCVKAFRVAADFEALHTNVAIGLGGEFFTFAGAELVF